MLGEFLAILDGDDYWTDSGKLRKQVALMDENTSASICFGRASILYEDGTPSKLIPPDTRTSWLLDDLLRESFIPTCTVLYRRKFDALPSWFEGLSLGDWPLHILQALSGPILFLDEVLAVYRVHGSGGWSQLVEETRWRKELDFYRAMVGVLPAPYDRIARCQMLERLWDEAQRCWRAGDSEGAARYFDEAIAAERPGAKLPARRKLRMKMRLRRGS